LLAGVVYDNIHSLVFKFFYIKIYYNFT